MIANKLKLSQNRIYARKCQIVEVDNKTANVFYDRNHIQGRGATPIHNFGLLYSGQLVALMSFSKHHRDNNSDNVILSRFANVINTNVIGAASKLLKHSINVIDKPILSWSDNRYSQGKLYNSLGFTKIKDLLADYCYTDGESIYNKQQFQKSKINCPPDITEYQWVKQQYGFDRLWDCGKRSWLLLN